MKPVEFPEQTHVLAESQPEYMPLPVHVGKTVAGTITSCWELSDDDLIEIVKTRKIWHQQMTFQTHYMPIILSVQKPELL